MADSGLNAIKVCEARNISEHGAPRVHRLREQTGVYRQGTPALAGCTKFLILTGANGSELEMDISEADAREFRFHAGLGF